MDISGIAIGPWASCWARSAWLRASGRASTGPRCLIFFAHFPIMMQQISIVVLVEVWVKRGSVTRETQDPNALRVRTENPNMKRLDKYKEPPGRLVHQRCRREAVERGSPVEQGSWDSPSSVPKPQYGIRRCAACAKLASEWSRQSWRWDRGCLIE